MNLMKNSLRNIKVSFIGGGKMTTSMVNNLIANKLLLPKQITISDHNKSKNEYFRSKWNIHTINDNYNACKNSDVVILAVKPQAIDKVFNNLENLSDKLICSVIAGVTLNTYQTKLKSNVKFVRIMPNTPCIIGEGMSVWCSNQLELDDINVVKSILQSFGKEMYVDDEKYLDIATAVSGTGPTYLYLLAESMIDSGVHLGLSREKTKEIVYQTILGSIQYTINSNVHPAILRNDITSPGGTSAEALYILEKNGFRGIISDAIWAAYNKSKQLGLK